MSAISAVWTKADEPPPRSLHQAMLSALEPYGRDRKCSWDSQRIALGANLSHSFPEDQFDQQPLWSQDRSVCIVADVRLDNRADLTRQLDLVHPETLSDSSILLTAWLRWGESCLDHLLGAFAFAIWAPGRGQLFAARDHAGERPLFYHHSDTLFALASMPQGLLVLPGLRRGFQQSRVIEWLAGLPYQRGETYFAGIACVPPGYFLRVTPDTCECRQYWHPANARPTRFKRDEEYAEALVEILDLATEARLRSTQPLGSFLSAGLDSSSVTASAARLLAERGESLTAFTSVPRPDFNGLAPPGYLPFEGNLAAEVARQYPNIEHVLVDSRGRDLLPSMKTWTDAWDQPAPNPANSLWIDAIFDQATQRGIGVLLAGDYGNCTISWSNWNILGDLFRRAQWLKLARTIRGLRSGGAISFKTAIRFSTRSFVPQGLTRRFLAKENLESLYKPIINPDWVARFNLEDRYFDTIYGGSTNPIEEHSKFFEHCDMGALNAASRAITGIEVRDPTADKRIFDFCFSVPPDQFLAGGRSRSLIRHAMKGRLPDSVRLETRRGLQSADWYLPVREALPAMRAELALIEQSPAAREVLDLPRIHSLLDTFPTSGYEQPRVRINWHSALTYAISMGYFLRSHDPALQPAATPAEAIGAPVQ
jgi:asparagine synthase (glutamine-hydrolysing)